jgi:hypothetical protein
MLAPMENYLQLKGITVMNYMAMYYRNVDAIEVVHEVSSRLVPVDERRYATLEEEVIIDVVEGASTPVLRSLACAARDTIWRARYPNNDGPNVHTAL